MRVIATKPGHDGRSLREAGDRFDMPEGSTGSWFDAVEVVKVSAPVEPVPPVPTFEVKEKAVEAPKKGAKHHDKA